METNLEDIIVEVEVLARSSKEDFEEEFWDNYSTYLEKYNEVLNRLHKIGLFSDLNSILPVPAGQKVPRSFGFSSAEQAKLREVANAAEILKRRIKLIIPKEDKPSKSAGEPLSRIEGLCTRFHLVACQLEKRYDNRETLRIKDEYDVQDLFHSLLRIYFDDVRTEIWTPEYAGGSSRMDFLLNREGIVVETKMTRDGLTKKRLGEELLVDIAKYKNFQQCKQLVCFIYDPQAKLENPRGLETDLEGVTKDIKIVAFVRPTGE